MHSSYKPASQCEIVALAPKFQAGSGVKLKGMRRRRSKAVVQQEKKELEQQFATGWVRKPSFVGQYAKRPDTTRLVEPEIKEFDLSDKGQLKEYNELFQQTIPHESPQVIFLSRDRQFCTGSEKWKILLEFCRVEYKPLIPLEDLQKP